MSQQEFFLFQSFYLFVVRLWKIELFDDVSDRNLNKFTKIFVKYNYHKYSKYLEIHRNSDHYIFKRKSYQTLNFNKEQNNISFHLPERIQGRNQQQSEINIIKNLINQFIINTKSEHPPIRPMTMFFDSLLVMMQKQKISQYLLNKITTLKLNPSHQMQNFIVQVISSDHISDGMTNFSTKFKKAAKKGSIIRLLDWSLDLQTFQIILNDWQYLGGAGYNINQGKPWDIQKVKLMTNSSIISKDFIVIHNPNHSKINQKLTNNPLFLGNSNPHDQNTRLAVEKVKIFDIKFLTFSASNRSKKEFLREGSKENRGNTIDRTYNQKLKLNNDHKKVEKLEQNEQDRTNLYKKKVQQIQQQISGKEQKGRKDEREILQSEEFESSINQENQMKVNEVDQNMQNMKVKERLNAQIFKYSQNEVSKARKIKISENQASSNLSIRTLLNKKSDELVFNRAVNSNEQVSTKINSMLQMKKEKKESPPKNEKDRHLVFNKEQISRLLGKND